jgi:type I restriction enzyme S subunit
MSNISFMDKLLEGVEVEWKPLGEVYKFQYGTGNTIPTIGGEYPVYGSNGIVGTHTEFNSEDAPVIGHIGAYAGIVNWGKGKHFVTYNGVICKLINDYVMSKYAYYQLLKQDFNSMAQSASHPFISYATLNKVLIPIPPLEIQAEIVRILDAFTEITAELTAELTKRKKQYNYYRDKLLTFDLPAGQAGDGEVEWKTLGEVTKIQRGASPRPIVRFITDDENAVPWIKIGDTFPNSKYVTQTKQKITIEGAKKSRILKKGDFIMSNSMSFGRPYILNIDGAIHDGWASISDFGDKLNSDYLFHYLSSNSVQAYWISKINSGSVSNLNADIIKSLPIPIHPLAEQERIVAILDKFDALTNSNSEGLPREIELRQKQYEYYRDLLLNFPKEKVEA